MATVIFQRYYPIAEINFRDFWDVCSHFQRVHKELAIISYSIDGKMAPLIAEEINVGTILKRLSHTSDSIRKITARFYTNAEDVARQHSNSKLIYLPARDDFQEPGLHLYSEAATKLSLYKFEEILYANYELPAPSTPEIEFGLPCEVLAAVVDMRGFSTFCEQPNIESPYTCGLMTSFYHLFKTCLSRYPPEMIKFLGDGVLAVWETSAEDRPVAVDVCFDAIFNINQRWAEVRRGPNFTHGAPKDIGIGVSFGLASRISIGGDYLGRPINIASRLCNICQPGQGLIDKSVPGLSPSPILKETKARLKSFGDYPVWALLTG